MGSRSLFTQFLVAIYLYIVLISVDPLIFFVVDVSLIVASCCFKAFNRTTLMFIFFSLMRTVKYLSRRLTTGNGPSYVA